jgi:hypothetical protein
VLKRANVTIKEFGMTEKEFTNRIDGLINDYEGGESTSKELRDGILDTLIELVSKVSPFEARVSPMLAEKWQKEKPNKPCYFIHRYNRKDNKPSLFEAVMDGGVLVVANIQDDEFVETMEDFAEGDFFIIEKY